MEILDAFKTIDITDKSLLQDQINYSREKYYECLESAEKINKKISNLKEENIEFTTTVYSLGLSPQATNAKIKADEDYNTRMAEIDGYERALVILNEKMNFIKSDLRILTNSMYNKF